MAPGLEEPSLSNDTETQRSDGVWYLHFHIFLIMADNCIYQQRAEAIGMCINPAVQFVQFTLRQHSVQIHYVFSVIIITYVDITVKNIWFSY